MKPLSFICLLIACLSSAFSQDWIRQNPFPLLAQIMDIDFDGQYGLAVGEEGICFTTDDYGTTWQPRTLFSQPYTFDAALVVPGSDGQVMYAGGIILMVTTDGGDHWEVAHNSPGSIHKLQILPDGSVLALGSDYNVLKKSSSDEWEVIPNPEPGASAGHFIDVMQGWVEAGDFENSQVWVTTNGGQSWNLRDTIKQPVIYGIQMLDANTGFMAGRDYVFKTTDGGHHWIQLHGNAVNSIQDMYVVNENEIWTCLNNGFIWYTRDGGNQWIENDPAIINSNRTNGIFANASGQVWATGKYVSIIYSDDAAQSWIDQVPGSKSILFRPHFYDEHHGLVGGTNGTVLWTQNGGAAWSHLKLAPDENLFGAMMLNTQTAIVGSSSGKVFLSEDTGQQWSEIGNNLGQIVDLHAFDMTNCIAVSEQGRIWHTVNGGANWNEVYTAPQGLLQAVHFVDAQHGWACGWFGQILHTANGGQTWLPQESNSAAQFTDIHFTSLTEGWIVSSSFSDSVWHTTNGGQTWEGSTLPYRVFWQGISFSSPDTGWITGGSSGFGIILRTDDGGQNWAQVHQSPEALFGIHAVPHKETAWSTGVGGNIVKYSPCTFSPVISSLTGESTPCQHDTVTYFIESSDVDLFEWTFPADWLVYGNTSTSSLQLIVGLNAGVVEVSGKDACGASTELLSLDVSPVAVPDAVITESNGTLTCNLLSGFYQWLRNGSPVNGADQQSFTPSVSGTYTVVVTLFATGCESRSNDLDIIISATDDLSATKWLIYPNPTHDEITISKIDGTTTDHLEYRLYSADGNLQFLSTIANNKLDLSGLPPGMYVLQVTSDNDHWVEKIILSPAR